MKQTRIYNLPLTTAPARGKLTSAEATALLNRLADDLAAKCKAVDVKPWPARYGDKR